MKRISRRTLLHVSAAGAGAALFAPLMREARAAGGTPARLVIVVECNGIYPVAFLSATAKAALGSSAVGGRIMFADTYPMSPMTLTGEALGSALCLDPLVTGGPSLESRAAVVLGLSSTITGGGHSSGTGALSCAVDGSAITFDAALAPRLKGSAPFEAIRLGTSASLSNIAYQTCSYGPRRPAPILVNPALAYDSVFGSLTSNPAIGRERTALFDFVRADVSQALSTFGGNSNERLKLERYLTSLDSLRARETQLKAMASAVQPLLPVAPAVNPLLTTAGTPPDSLKWLEAQFEIATASLLGGLTNTVVLASGTSGFDVRYPSVIANIGRHDLQHGIGNPANWTAIAAVTRKHVELIAKLARTLASTPEVGAPGSMLDHTAIVYMSDNGEQHHSTATEWPMLLLGGNALGLKTDGRTVIYPRDGAPANRQVSNAFNSLGHALGDDTMDTFGNEGPSRIAAGPLSELYG